MSAATCSERVSKYNDLLRIEERLGARAWCGGKEVFGDGLTRG
ncbi:MAG: hypothetical protein LAN62_05745 [Acidobacteriia bacterium]|nr:hypothetical protein [Terriglobia bacterium]